MNRNMVLDPHHLIKSTWGQGELSRSWNLVGGWEGIRRNGVEKGSQLLGWNSITVLLAVVLGDRTYKSGGGRQRPLFGFLYFCFYCLDLLKQNIFFNSAFSSIPTHFSFLHLLLRCQVRTIIIFFDHFSFSLYALIGLRSPFTYRLNSCLGPFWPREPGLSIIEGLSLWHCWALTVCFPDAIPLENSASFTQRRCTLL